MKKIIGLLTAAIIVLQLAVIPVSATNIDADSEQWTTMQIFGVIHSDVSTESTFSIADMAQMLYRLMNIKTPAEPEATRQIYADVDRWHWAAGYIEWLYNNKVYAGDGSGAFEPDRTVMLSDVCTVALNLLGYKYMLDNISPDADVISSAAQFNLIPNNVGKIEHEINYGEFASICYRMLLTKIIEPTLGAKSGYEKKGEFISEVLGIQYSKGVLTGANGYSLDNNLCGNRQVIIDNNTFKIKSDAVFTQFLGYCVKYYYDAKELELIAVVPMTNNEIVIDSKDILDYDSDTYKYEVDGHTKTAKHTDPVLLLYNGKITSNRAAFTPAYGRVRLIDNDDDGKFDVVISENSFNIILEKVVGDIIYGKNLDNSGRKYTIDLSDFTLTEFVGNDVPINELKEGTVITAAISEDGTYGRFYVCEKNVSGNLEAVDTDSYTLGDTEYFLANDIFDPQIVSVGRSVRIFFDIYGKIAAIASNNEDEYAFGYLMSIREDRREDRLILKMLTENGISKLYTYRKLTIDDIKASSTSAAETTLTPHIGELIRYRLYGSEIRFIDTMVTSAGFTAAPTLLGTNSLRMIADGKMLYKSNPQLFKSYETAMPTYSEFAVNDSTKVFFVPAGNSDEDNDFYVGNISSLYDDLEARVEGYVTGKSTFVAEAVVVRYNMNVLIATPFTVVEKITTALDADDSIVNIIHGMSGGKNTDLIVTDETLLTRDGNIAKGSIIRCRTDKNGEVKDITNIYSMDGSGKLNNSLHEYNHGAGSGRFSNVRAVLGYIYDREGTVARFKFKDAAQVDEMFNLKNCNFYVYTGGREGVKIGTIDDLYDDLHHRSEHDEVVISTRGARTVDVFLIRQ